MVWKRNRVCCDEPIVVNALMDSDVGVVVADDVYEGKSITKDKSNIGRDTDAQVFARSRSSQGPSDIEVVAHGKSGVPEKTYDANAAAELGNPVRNEETGDAARSRASSVPRPSVEDVLHASHIQKLQAENGAILARRA